MLNSYLFIHYLKDAEIQRLVGDLEKTVEDAFFSPERPESSSSLVLPVRKVSCDIGDMNAGPNSSGPPLHYVQVINKRYKLEYFRS